MAVLKGHEKTDKFIEREMEIQEIANAKTLDKEAFLALYSYPPILYNNNEVSREFYDIEQKPAENRLRIECVVNWLEGKQEMSVLDIGCGKEMKTLKILRDKGFKKLTGVDILDESMLHEHDGIEYMQQPKLPQKHDIVICMETLEHISTNNTMDFWEYLYGLFDKEILITTPHSPSLENFMIKCPLCNRWTTESGHVRYNPPSVIVAEAAVNNIEIVEQIKYAPATESWAYRGVKI